MRNQTALKARISRVLEKLERGQTAEAARLCRALLRESPGEAALHQLDAAVALKEGRAAEALAAARRALALRPAGHGPSLMLAGKAARETGDIALAQALLAEAAALMPERPEPNFLHCAALLEGGAPEAKPTLERLLRDFPKSFTEWREIADILYRSGKPGMALHVLEQITDRAPEVELLLKRAIVLRELGRVPEARRVLERATHRNPGSARAWFLLGLTLQDEHLPGEAASAFAAARRAKPGFAEAAVNEGIAWQETGDLDAARRAYGEAVRLRADTFGRITQAMTAAPKGELWLDLEALRLSLAR